MLSAVMMSLVIKKIADHYKLPSDELFALATEVTLEFNKMSHEAVDNLIDSALKNFLKDAN